MALNFWKKLTNPLITKLGRMKEKAKFDKKPIIIGGSPRSGTTLLLSIIGAHPDIYAFPEELGVFFEWHNEVQYFFNDKRGRGKLVPRLDRFYRAMLKFSIPNNVTRRCEKSPRNVTHFGKNLDFFDGEVQLIHIIRDVRDVMLSKHPTKPNEYWVEPEKWVKCVKAGLEYKDHPQVLTIKYENLILNSTQTIKKICEFLNEKCVEELYDYFEHTNVQNSSAWYNGVQKLHSESVEKWKKDENQARVEEVMENEEVIELLKRLDYPVKKS